MQTTEMVQCRRRLELAAQSSNGYFANWGIGFGKKRRRFESAWIHVSIHDSPDTVADFEAAGLVKPAMRVKSASTHQLHYERYHIVKCSLVYTRSQGPQEGVFSVAFTSESAKLSGWLREPSILYRELVTLAPEDEHLVEPPHQRSSKALDCGR